MLVREATPSDVDAMMAIHAEIIAIGGTTAYLTPFDRDGFVANYLGAQTKICCVVADGPQGVIGFQSLGVWPGLPDGWADIGTFVHPGLQRAGIGAPLFAATKAVADQAGVAVINASIRADNVPGLGYYARRGFVEYDRIPGYALADGRIVGRVLMRFDLRQAGAGVAAI